MGSVYGLVSLKDQTGLEKTPDYAYSLPSSWSEGWYGTEADGLGG